MFLNFFLCFNESLSWRLKWLFDNVTCSLNIIAIILKLKFKLLSLFILGELLHIWTFDWIDWFNSVLRRICNIIFQPYNSGNCWYTEVNEVDHKSDTLFLVLFLSVFYRIARIRKTIRSSMLQFISSMNLSLTWPLI